MAQIITTLCDRHLDRGERVETTVAAVRISITGGNKLKTDIEGDYCSDCIDELLEAVGSYVAAGRRPGPARVTSSLAPSVTPSPNDAQPVTARKRGPNKVIPPGVPRNDDGTPIRDAYGKPILNGGDKTCRAPGVDCIRARIGFNTGQAQSSHERVAHGYVHSKRLVSAAR